MIGAWCTVVFGMWHGKALTCYLVNVTLGRELFVVFSGAKIAVSDLPAVVRVVVAD